MHNEEHNLFFILEISATKADCDTLPDIANTKNNATGTGPFVSGTVIRFICEDGYNPTGTNLDYRCSGTQWVDGNMKCEEIFCPYVETPENGKIVNEPSHRVGTTIEFKCNEGYDRVGNSKLLCRIDGKWYPEDPPRCDIKMCGEFGYIQHATTFQDSSYIVRNGYGSIVEVTCDEHYIIKGKPRVMCQADGNWGDKPVCEKSECPIYPGLNSSCIKETNIFDNLLFITCRDDVPNTRAEPDEAAECLNGAWDIPNIACYCHCKVEADLKRVSLKNVGSIGHLKHDATLQWSCKSNYEKDTTSNLHCFDGNIIKPICKAKGTVKPDVTVTYKPVTDKDRSTVNPPQTTTGKPVPKSNNLVVIIIGVVVGGGGGGGSIAVLVVCCVNTKCILNQKFFSKKNGKFCAKCKNESSNCQCEKIVIMEKEVVMVNTEGEAVMVKMEEEAVMVKMGGEAV